MAVPGSSGGALAGWEFADDHLDRPTQDRLEAAVVLEAWGGVAPGEAFDLIDAGRPSEQAAFVVRAVRSEPLDSAIALGDLGFVAGILGMGFYLSTLTADLGARTVDTAWRIALPISLALQWAMRRRYLSGADGLGRLRNDRRVPIVILAAMALCSAVPPGGWLAACLIGIWVGGFLITRLGWGLAFGAALLGGAGLLRSGADARLVLPALAGVSLVVAGFGVVRRHPSDRLPGGAPRAVAAGLIGAGVGGILVLEPRFAWTGGPALVAITVVPALLGSVWGGWHMGRLWKVLPEALVRQPFTVDGPGADVAVVRSLLGGAVVRLLAGAVAFSVPIVLWARAGSGPVDDVVSLLGAHLLLGLAGLAVSMLEAFDRWGTALFAVTAGCAACVVVNVFDPSHHLVPGSRIALGALVALVIAGPPLLAVVSSPARTLAARL